MTRSEDQERRCQGCRTPLARDNRSWLCSPCSRREVQVSSAPLKPDEFWERPALRDARKARHFGQVINAYRHEHRPVLTQAKVGRWLGLTQGQISRLERTAQPTHDLNKLDQWSRALHIPERYLWFRLSQRSARAYVRPRNAHGLDDDRTAATGVHLVPAVSGQSALIALDDIDVSRWWGPADTVEIVSQFTRNDLTVDRRPVARMLTGVFSGSALLEPLERWLMGGMEKSRVGRPGSVGYQEVEQIENVARIFRDWDDQFGGGLRRKAVVGQLSEVADLLRDSHPVEIKRRLFGAMAQLSETAAMMSWDSGYQALAQRYYVLSLRASRAAGDRVFGANVMAAMARQLVYLDHADDALELVRLAQDDSAGYAPASVRSMLYTREAWAYAKLGRISAFRRVTDKAEDALTEAKPAEDPYWITYFDVAELQGTTGGRLRELASQDKQFADEAVERISQAIALRRPGRLRSSALDQIGLAQARLIQGEMEEASRLGHQAVVLVEQTPSDRVRVKLAGLYQHSNTHADVPVIASLRDRIRSLCAAQPI